MSPPKTLLKTPPIDQVMSQFESQLESKIEPRIEPELAAWLLEGIPNNHWVRIRYQFPDVLGTTGEVSSVPLAAVTYRIVSLQDENICVSGTLDSQGRAYHEGFVPGPIVVHLSTEDTVAVEMEVDNFQQNLLQSFDSLVVLLLSQKLSLNQNLQQKQFEHYQRYLFPQDQATTLITKTWQHSSQLALPAQSLYPAIVSAVVDKEPITVIQLLDAFGPLSEEHKTSIFLLTSDDTLVSMLKRFIENIWRDTDDCVYVRGFVLDLLNALLIEALLGKDVFIVNGALSLFGYCKQFCSPAAQLLDEIVEQLRGLIPLFGQSKISTTLQGRTNTEVIVRWREPPNPQRCDKHYSNIALMPTNVNGDLIAEGDEHLIDGDYVYRATGEVVFSHTDFELNGPVPLQWTRHFRSSTTGGWSCVANEDIYVSKGWVNYRREDGVIIIFELPPIGKYSTNVTCGLVLHRVFYSVFVIKGKGDTQKVFRGLYSTTLPQDRSGAVEEIIPLTQVKNQYSEGWQFRYKLLDHGCYQLLGVESSWGHKLSIEWNMSGFITRVLNKNDGKALVQYDWGSSGLLNAISDAKGCWQYVYLSGDPTLISAMTYPNGACVGWQYDAQGQVRISAPEKTEQHSYDKNHLLASYIDVEGNVTQYRYNAEGMLTAFIDPAGGGFSLSYDDESRVQEVTNALGESWGCEYNKEGAIEVLVDPEGVAYRINSVSGRPVSMLADIETDAEAEPLSVQRYWQWDACANLIMDSANGRLNQATYDGYGKLIQLADRGQEILSFDYNSQNQLQKIGANGAGQLALTYHGSGMVSQILKASGQCIDLQFDDFGRLLMWNERASLEKKMQSLSIQYDSQGRVLRLDCHGKNTGSLQFQYGNGPLPNACTDATGGDFKLKFGEKGLLHCLLSSSEALKTIWQYDACGRQVYRSNTREEVKTQYDVLGRVVEHLEGNKVIQCVYQSRGQLAQYTSTLGNIEHTYNALGYRVNTTYSNGYVVVYRYSAPGMLEKIEINGNVVLEYVRDAAGAELYQKQGACQYEGDSSTTQWIDNCFNKKVEEAIEEIRLRPANKNQPGLITYLMLALQLDTLDLPPLLQQNVKGLQDNGNAMRGIAKIPESSQIEDGIVVHHPVSGEPLLIIYQNQVYFYESDCEPMWRDWNGHDVTLKGVCVAREWLPIKPLGDVDIAAVVKEPYGGMLWDFVTEGVATTVMSAISLTSKSKKL